MAVRSIGVLAGLALSVSSPAVAQDTAKVERGQAVFAEQKCALCHSVGGKGNTKGALDDVGSKVTADEMRQWLVSPKEMGEKAKATRKPPMKSFATKLTDDEKREIANWIVTLKKTN